MCVWLRACARACTLKTSSHLAAQDAIRRDENLIVSAAQPCDRVRVLIPGPHPGDSDRGLARSAAADEQDRAPGRPAAAPWQPLVDEHVLPVDEKLFSTAPLSTHQFLIIILQEDILKVSITILNVPTCHLE